MSTRVQRWCVWSGAGFVGLFGIGYCLLAGLVPPPSPTDTPVQVATFYATDTTLLKLGLLLTLAATPLQIPFSAAISMQMKRIEGEFAPLSYVQFGCGALAALVITIPVGIMLSAAFRPDRNPDVTQGLNDVAWCLFLGVFFIAFLQNVVIGISMLIDQHAEPIFPRWLGYLNIWLALGFLPAGLLFFFKTGPFAWPGLFTWWIPAGLFFAWFAVMLVMLLRAIRVQEARAVDLHGVEA